MLQLPIIPLHLSVTTETWLGSVYSTYSQAKHAVDHSYEISTFQRGLQCRTYRVVQKTDPQFYFWDNFGNSAPILIILSLLQAEIYGA